MAVFGDYARYYNLLYKDKDYAAESRFVLDRLRSCGCTPQTLLDLGCGTGRHALEVARHGISVTGVDMSQTMLDVGRQALTEHAKLESFPLPQMFEGDVRTIRLHQTYDAVTSLFHVMSYQNREEDALAELETAKQHLRPGGIFLFDFWYGPGVLTDPPTGRDKIMEDADTLVRRHAHPVHRVNDNIVEVHYTIMLTDKHSGTQSELHEMHSMRYWFLPELRHLVRQAGMTVVAEGAWLGDKIPDCNTWNAWVAVQQPKI